jgi:hypothetical protein
VNPESRLLLRLREDEQLSALLGEKANHITPITSMAEFARVRGCESGRPEFEFARNWIFRALSRKYPTYRLGTCISHSVDPMQAWEGIRE